MSVIRNSGAEHLMATRKSTKAASAGGVRTWKREQGWDRLGTEGEAALEAYCRDYVDYLSRAKTERLAHDLALEAARNRTRACCSSSCASWMASAVRDRASSVYSLQT